MSEMSMIEKMARAIFRAGFHADDPESVVAAKWDEWPESRQQSRRKARFAIEAMRGPTRDMLHAAVDATGAGSGMSWVNRSPQTLFEQGHQAMIDSILTEESSK